MTDNEIIEALECCETGDCLSCPKWKNEYVAGECNDILHFALGLINRQKAEIERLQKHNTEMARKHYDDGIKEFAEKVKAMNDTRLILLDEHIDNLVKEMTEGEQDELLRKKREEA